MVCAPAATGVMIALYQARCVRSKPIMRPMQTLRNVHLLARFVLVWFALSMGVAVASPLVKPQAMELICAGTGVMKFVKQGADGSAEPVSLTLDCPLCANLGAPPPAFAAHPTLVFGLAFALLPVEAARIASLLRGPWQARAPPASS